MFRKNWRNDKPLSLGEGDAAEALSPAKLAFGDFIKEGQTLTGLLCLTQLSMDYDNKMFVQDAMQIEKLARILFTDGQAADANPQELLVDTWYEQHKIILPHSLSEKETIPVVVRDASKMPAAFRQLGMCEWVSAFWKMVDRVGKQKASAEAPSKWRLDP